MRRTLVVLILAHVLGGCREQRVVDRDRPPAVPDAAIAPVDPLTDAYLTRFIAAHHSDDWYGFHIQDRKVGSANLTMRPTAPGEPGAYAVTMAMALQVEGADGGTSYTQTSFYAGTPPFALVALHKRETSGASVAESTYVCGPDGIDVTATADGQAAPSRRLPPTRETLASAVSELALPADVAVGLRMSQMAFDSDAGIDQPKTIIVDRAVDETLAGVKVRVVTVSSHDDGQTQPTVMRMAGGKALSISIGPAARLELADRVDAQSAIQQLSMMDSATPVDRALGDTPALAELKLVVAARPGFVFPSGPHQQVTPRPDGRHDIVLRAVPGPAVGADDRAAALAATVEYDADAPTIAALARQLVDGAATDRAKVDRIVDWVHRHLAKDLATNLSTASQVLIHGRGDCTEHTLLTVALVRAAGIPAREVGGLMYGGDDTQRFFWHAWAQVALDGHWVAIDATWGQRIADVGHLMFTDDDGNDGLSNLGQLTIEAPPP